MARKFVFIHKNEFPAMDTVYKYPTSGKKVRFLSIKTNFQLAIRFTNSQLAARKCVLSIKNEFSARDTLVVRSTHTQIAARKCVF